jgi:pyruvate formate lyase activating enzyme
MITNIQYFSVDDGPGIRTTLFLKGCCMHCRWCHNPETITPGRQLQYKKNLCRACGRCVKSCPQGVFSISSKGHEINRESCNDCLSCVEACPYGALEAVGYEIDVGTACTKLRRDRAFYEQSGGGITISGGEPLFQPDFCIELLAALQKEGFHTALDTSGNVPFEILDSVLPYTNLVLYDIKLPNASLLRELCGGDALLVRRNLERLCECRTDIWVRVPMLMQVNDNAETVDAIVDMLCGKTNIKRVQLLPYHKYGLGKYDVLGMCRPEFETPPDEKMNEAVMRFCSAGLPAEWKGENLCNGNSHGNTL